MSKNANKKLYQIKNLSSNISEHIDLGNLENNSIATITTTLISYFQHYNYFNNYPADFIYKFSSITPFMAKLNLKSTNQNLNYHLNLTFTTKTPTLSSILNHLANLISEPILLLNWKSNINNLLKHESQLKVLLSVCLKTYNILPEIIKNKETQTYFVNYSAILLNREYIDDLQQISTQIILNTPENDLKTKIIIIKFYTEHAENQYYNFQAILQVLNTKTLVTNFNNLSIQLPNSYNVKQEEIAEFITKPISKFISEYQEKLIMIARIITNNYQNYHISNFPQTVSTTITMSNTQELSPEAIIAAVINKINNIDHKETITTVVYSFDINKEFITAEAMQSSLIKIYVQKTNINNIFKILFPNNFKIIVTIVYI